MNFQAFVRDIRDNGWNVFGAQVWQDGRLTHSFGDTERRHPIYSAAKTITSIAVGMASDDGKIEIDRPVLEYLPADAVKRMPEAQRAVYGKITVERLLTMSVSGYPFRPSGVSWLDEALKYELNDPDSRIFDYSNVSAYLAGVATANAVGENLYDYLNRKLFAPLGIVSPPHAVCPDGYFYGATGMELSVDELSRVGLLLYQGGAYGGRRILSEDYVHQMTGLRQMNREGGYGYFVWKYRSGCSINGKWGQKCYVLPKEGLMVTYLSHIEEKCPGMRAGMERHILGV